MNPDLRAIVLIIAFVALVIAIAVTSDDRPRQPLTWVAFAIALYVLTWVFDAAKAAGWW